MNINHTRAMVRAALSGRLAGAPTRFDPIFRVEVPLEIHDVPAEFLDPRSTWTDQAAYDRAARRLAAMFAKNFDAYADGVDPAIRAAGPLTTLEDVAAVSGPIEGSSAG
jgi:phosphoenolpyruvate carboxykinase (ATP)